jgi:hypothetical protein
MLQSRHFRSISSKGYSMNRLSVWFLLFSGFFCQIGLSAQNQNASTLQRIAQAPSTNTAGSGVQLIAPSLKKPSSNGIIQGATPLAATASNIFEGFVRFPAETRQFIPMDANTAYYRDVFGGGETLTSGANDGDIISATIQAPNESVPVQAIPFVFHAQFNGQQNCWVSPGITPLCNTTSIDVTWFRQIQCAQDGVWTMQFLYNGAVFSSGTFTVLPQVKQDAIPDIYSQLDYSNPVTQTYDSICRTVNPDGSLARDSHICSDPLLPTETPWLINGKGCFLSSTAMVFGYFKASITPPDLNDFLKGQDQGYVGAGAVNSTVATRSPRNRNVNVTAKGADSTAHLSQNVCSAGPQLMGVKCVDRHGVQKATHWVLAYGRDTNKTTWLIVDPNGGSRTTLQTKYNNTFCETRVFQGPEFTFTDSRGITVSFHSPGELLITDPNGLRLGYDPIFDQSYTEIPNASYDDVGLQDDVTELPADDTDTGKSLGLPGAPDGDYTLTITGTGVGTYNMEVQGLDVNGLSSVSKFQNVPLAPNLVQRMVLHYSSAPGSQIQLGGALDGGGANHFLSFASPVKQASLVPAGQNNFPVIIFYASNINPASFTASLNGQDQTALFHPAPGASETVNLPLPNGLSSLNLQISGTNAGGQVATDTDTLQFDVGGSAPVAPTALTATTITDTQINLNWTASTGSGVTYSVFRSTASGFTPSSANQIASGLSGTTFVDTGLIASTTYFYLVEAVDTFASSAASNQASATTLTPGSCAGVSSTITANFNGTAIPSGDTLWFNSVLKASGLGSHPVTIFVRKGTISFTANGVPFTVAVPDANVTFDPTVTVATTTFDTTNNLWRTTVPSTGLAGNVFLDGAELRLPNGLPGGIKNVSWTATFSTDTQGVTFNWQWAAAAYTSLGVNCTNTGPDFNDLGVKPVDDNKASQYQNSDHAGTPEDYKPFVVGGATGGGGSNFTGSYSGTKSVTPGLVNSCGTNPQPPSCT